MRKLLIPVLALCLALSAMSAVAEPLLDEIRARGELRVATEGTWSPWTFHDETDALVGFDVEVARAVAAKLGVEAAFAETEWDPIFAGIDARRYDLAANGVEITPERAEKYNFSTPYAYIRTALVVRGDNQDIQSFEDLSGKKTANSIASTYMMLAESYGAQAVGVDTLGETLEMVISGRADATLNAEVSIYDYLEVHPLADIRIVALTDEASEVSLPIRKGEENESLLAEVNAAIEALRQEGTLSEISLRYFGRDITIPPSL